MDWKDKHEVVKALLGLYHRQTADEQIQHSTHHQNSIGFNALDARFCSSVAEWVLSDKSLTPAQFERVKITIMKYKRQIAEMDLDSIELPPTVQDKPVRKTKEKRQGKLTLNEKGQLVFYPYVYPTNVIKGKGFWGGKDDDGSFRWTTHFSLDKIYIVLDLWPDVKVTSKVQAAVDQLAMLEELPGDIVKHKTLYDFQKEAIKFLTSSPRTILGLAPGLGKTAASIFAADTVGAENILVISPLTLCWKWAREVDKWIGKEAAIWHGNPDKWPMFENWVITNYDTAWRKRAEFLKEPWDVIIIDESVLLANYKRKKVDDEEGKKRWRFTTQRVQGIYEIVQSYPDAKVWMLSGSGGVSKLYSDVWAQLHILDRKRFGSYWRFTENYCDVEKGKWGWKVLGNQPNAYKRIQRDFADIYFARTQDQVLNLPDWVIDPIEVPMTLIQNREYGRMEDEFFTELEDGASLTASNTLAQMTRLIQLASNPVLIGGKDTGGKWRAVIEMLDWVTFPIVIWTNFIPTATRMFSKLKTANRKLKIEVLTGKTKSRDRQPIVDTFEGGHLDILIAHPEVGKFGLDLVAARTAIYLERSFDRDDYFQSLHRVRRIGTKFSPHVIPLISIRPNSKESTVDHAIHHVLSYSADQAFKLTTSTLYEAWGKEGQHGSTG